MRRALLLGFMTLLQIGQVQAGTASPWDDGQDLERFYAQYCDATDLEKKYFPMLEPKQLEGLRKIISETLWSDVSDDLLSIESSSTTAVVKRLRSLGRPISPSFLSMVQQAAQEPLHSNYVHAHNTNLVHRDHMLETFKTLGTNDIQLGSAMVTVLDCRIIRNVKTMDPFVTKRVAQVKKMNLTIQRSSPNSSSAKPSGGYSDPECACGGGNFCYGPRGGHYCITSGGNKTYVPH